jgi:alkylhydroperoxidase family enzyme
MVLPRLLSWSPQLALASGILEAAATKPEGALTPRLLKMLRLDVSLRASCAFCLDMNAVDFEAVGILRSEMEALQKGTHPDRIDTLVATERLALRLARALTETPISMDTNLAAEARRLFSEREYLLLVATCAQVNYWARLAQGLGIAPEGFAPDCTI